MSRTEAGDHHPPVRGAARLRCAARVGASLWRSRRTGGTGRRDRSGARPRRRSTTPKSWNGMGSIWPDQAKEPAASVSAPSPPTLDAKLEHIMPLVNPMGAGVTVLDYDADGRLDLYFVDERRGGPERPLPQPRRRDVRRDRRRDGGSPTSTSQAPEPAWARSPPTTTTTAIPISSSTSGAARSCSTTTEGKRFERVTDGRRVCRPWANINAACWLDYDRDGRLDLFLAGYWRDDIDLWNLEVPRTSCRSRSSSRPTAAASTCSSNLGDGTVRRRHLGGRDRQHAVDAGGRGGDVDGNGYRISCWRTTTASPRSTPIGTEEKFDEVGYETGSASPQERYERQPGGPAQRGAAGGLRHQHHRAGNLVQGNNLWVLTEETAGRAPAVCQSGGFAQHRAGRAGAGEPGSVTSTTTAGSTCILTNGYVSAAARQELLVRLRQDRPGAQGADRGRQVTGPRSATRASPAIQTKCVWLNKGGDFTDVCGRGRRHGRRYDGPGHRLGRPLQPGRPRCCYRATRTAKPSSTGTPSRRGTATGSSSSSPAALTGCQAERRGVCNTVEQPQRRRGPKSS